MNISRYPLIASGTFLVLWAAHPVFALEPETVLTDKSFDLSAIATPSDQLTPQPLTLAKSSAIAPKPTDFSDRQFELGDVSLTGQEERKPSIEPSNPHPTMELAQFPPAPPAGGIMVPQPEIIIRSNGTGAPDILQQTAPIAPTLPRASAPPVGDMAISNINASPDVVDLGSSSLIPRLVLRQAPAREVLAVLARYAGMNLVFTDAPGGGAAGSAGGQGQPPATGAEPTVSLDLENEPVQSVFNSVLMISGLQANRRGKTIFVGSQLPQAAQNLVSRTLRLNQVKSFNAGTFLASQGAEFQRLVIKTEDITDPLTGRVIGRRELPSNLEGIQVNLAQGTSAPLLLRGLRVSADDRLNAVTLVGEPRQVQVATSLLTQLDARRRQVAVNVKVVDINLNNIQDYNSSFSFGINDSFFIQDNGAAVLRFGSTSPVTSGDINSASGRATNPPSIVNPLGPLGGNPANTFIDPNQFTTIPGFGAGTVFIDQITGSITEIANDAAFFNRVAGISTDPTFAGITDLTRGTANVITRNSDGTTTVTRGTFPTATAGLPSYLQYPKKFQALIDAQIRSGNAKILTDPTLVVQEGQEATVKLVQKVIESIDTQVDPLSGVRTTTPRLADAGLTLVVNVDKIDDNGFISISVSPTIASIGQTQRFDSGQGTFNDLQLLNRRELTSGLVRLRDGQTFILSGVIAEEDRTTTSKVPILGDIPVLGALFRSQSNTTNRTEVIILVTPQLIDDNTDAQFGYNYAPGREAAGVLRDKGFPIQVQP